MTIQVVGWQCLDSNSNITSTVKSDDNLEDNDRPVTVTTHGHIIQIRPDPIHGKPCARSSHGVSVLRNGSRIIVYGGEHIARTPLDRCTSATWACDRTVTASSSLSITPNTTDVDHVVKSETIEETFQWRLLQFDHTNPDSAPSDRLGHSQAVYQDQYVYIFGGRSGIGMNESAMNDLWRLDCSGEPGTETWSRILVMDDGTNTTTTTPEPRSFHRMVCVGDSLYAFGGCGTGKTGRLADLYRFDLSPSSSSDAVWHRLGTAPGLRGRGGANFFTVHNQTKLAVIAGFCGEESADGQLYDLTKNVWLDDILSPQDAFSGMRPRSVCVATSLSPTLPYAIIFGGEVDPSDRGHEGAGNFEDDIVILSDQEARIQQLIPGQSMMPWPRGRGWSAADAVPNTNKVNSAYLYMFGGLAGNDVTPERLDDFWRLELQSQED